ncbi:MAG: hypothetical protein JWR51_4722 [Devosia sp.]|uniref:portal protein n=1 Tax=Devosia sp. TaxID=1871048 RepID=UPI002627FF48|nr:portal protein [Devosia sp.]MDB5531619.1 hypothetical protein [Devosia sp.]
MAEETNDRDLKDDEKIVKEARDRFAICEGYYSHAYSMWREDFRFGHADSDNMAQWPDALLTTREIAQKPTLTVNKTRIHCLQIVNDAKQNKPGIVVHPTTNEATYKAAEIYEDVVRHIEYRSRAQQAYDKASENQVFGGLGFCRVTTEYASPNGFDQEIRIGGVRDPLSIYMDPDAKEADKSDAEYGFEFDDMSVEKFKRDFPGHPEAVNAATLNNTSFDGWLTKEHVRVANYWRKKHEKVVLVSVVDPNTGERRTVPKKTISPDLIKLIKQDKNWDYRERDSDVVTVECIKFAGSTVIDRYDWLGKWIPLVPCIGEEVILDGQLDLKGHVRYLKDAQRMYNYNTSAEVEFGALQTKIPFLGPADAFEGYEEYYASANLQNLGFLPYKHRDDQGQEIPAPKRVEPPMMSNVFLKGMEIAQQELMMASGQYQSQMGEQENAKSGKAIAERQRQGDNATYHFVDNHAIMVRQIGRIVVDLIPKIYDTTRILRIRGDDGMMKNITIDPQAQQAVQEQKDIQKQEVDIIFNPNVGEYAVEVDVGPSFATRRQEAWNAIVQILTQSPQLIPIVGDLLFQNADFPGADEIAVRLRRMTPPQALGDDPSPQDAEMQAHVGQLTQLVAELNQKLANKDADANIRAFEASVKAFEAMSKRLQVIGNAGPIVTPEQEQPIIQSTLGSMQMQPTPASVPSPQIEQMQQPPQMQPPMPDQQQLAPPPMGMPQ